MIKDIMDAHMICDDCQHIINDDDLYFVCEICGHILCEICVDYQETNDGNYIDICCGEEMTIHNKHLLKP